MKRTSKHGENYSIAPTDKEYVFNLFKHIGAVLRLPEPLEEPPQVLNQNESQGFLIGSSSLRGLLVGGDELQQQYNTINDLDLIKQSLENLKALLDKQQNNLLLAVKEKEKKIRQDIIHSCTPTDRILERINTSYNSGDLKIEQNRRTILN
jgi:hypothetical protein